MRADATRASDEGGAHRIPPAIATDFVMTILDGETQALLPRAAPSPPRARVPGPGLAPRASRKPRWAATVTGLVAPALATLLLLGAALAAAGTSPFATRNAALGDAVDDYLHAHVAVPVDGRNAALGVEAHVGSAHGARHARERHHTAAARTTHKPHVRKPRILIAVISWNGGGEEVRALHDTWLPALKDAHPDVEADYAVFVGRPEPARLGGDGAFARTHSSLGRTNNDARARDAVEVDDAPEYTASAGAIGNLIISPDPVAEEKLRRVSDNLDEATRAAEKSREDARAVNASEPSGAAEKAKKSKDSKVSDASEASKDAAKVSDASEASKDAAKDDAAKIGISDSSTDSSTDSEGFPEEHLVRLDVGDAYEDLPAKVIAAVRWAKDNSPPACAAGLSGQGEQRGALPIMTLAQCSAMAMESGGPSSTTCRTVPLGKRSVDDERLAVPFMDASAPWVSTMSNMESMRSSTAHRSSAWMRVSGSCSLQLACSTRHGFIALVVVVVVVVVVAPSTSLLPSVEYASLSALS